MSLPIGDVSRLPGPVRRPLRSRDRGWARAAAGRLARARLRPNQISVASVGFAGLGAVALWLVPHAPAGVRIALCLGAALGIQLRLLANLLDGMVAIEGGLGTPSGGFFNEFPDRVSDVVLLLAAGSVAAAAGWPVELGWAAALLAVLTAYVRALGATLGAAEPFCGPMAKPQRMAVLTAACLGAAAEAALGAAPRALPLALVVIAAGSALTLARRARRIVTELERRAPRAT